LNASLYLQRIIRAGVSYISGIGYTNSPELVWKSGPVAEIMITSDSIGVLDISIKGDKQKPLLCDRRYGLWYKSIGSLPDKSL
jgi:hypothetical protein